MLSIQKLQYDKLFHVSYWFMWHKLCLPSLVLGCIWDLPCQWGSEIKRTWQTTINNYNSGTKHRQIILGPLFLYMYTTVFSRKKTRFFSLPFRAGVNYLTGSISRKQHVIGRKSCYGSYNLYKCITPTQQTINCIS